MLALLVAGLNYWDAHRQHAEEPNAHWSGLAPKPPSSSLGRRIHRDETSCWRP